MGSRLSTTLKTNGKCIAGVPSGDRNLSNSRILELQLYPNPSKNKSNGLAASDNFVNSVFNIVFNEVENDQET